VTDKEKAEKTLRNSAWTQDSELRFLDRLGTFSDGAARKVEDVSPWLRCFLLRGYLKALEHPRTWFPGADPAALKAHAEALLLVEHERMKFNQSTPVECVH